MNMTLQREDGDLAFIYCASKSHKAILLRLSLLFHHFLPLPSFLNFSLSSFSFFHPLHLLSGSSLSVAEVADNPSLLPTFHYSISQLGCYTHFFVPPLHQLEWNHIITTTKKNRGSIFFQKATIYSYRELVSYLDFLSYRICPISNIQFCRVFFFVFRIRKDHYPGK